LPFTSKRGLKKSTVKEFNLSQRDIDIFANMHKFDHVRTNIRLAGSTNVMAVERKRFLGSRFNRIHVNNINLIQNEAVKVEQLKIDATATKMKKWDSFR
jgi:hypothetical protein